MRQLFNQLRIGIFFIFFTYMIPSCCLAYLWDDWFGRQADHEEVVESSIEDCKSIFDAITSNRVENIELLLLKGHSLEERNSEGLTPLLYAITKGSSENIVANLLAWGANTEAVDYRGNTALLKCCGLLGTKNKNSIGNILLEYGADTEARNQNGCTPLIEAAKNNEMMMLRALLDRGVNKEARNDDSKTALMLAAENNHVTVVNILLASGSFVNATDSNGMTPLMHASYKGNMSVIQVLLQYDADLTAQLWNSMTIGILKESNDLSRLLDPYKKKVEVPVGSTALTFASLFAGKGTEKILLEAWAKKDPAMQEYLIEWKKELLQL